MSVDHTPLSKAERYLLRRAAEVNGKPVVSAEDWRHLLDDLDAAYLVIANLRSNTICSACREEWGYDHSRCICPCHAAKRGVEEAADKILRKAGVLDG